MPVGVKLPISVLRYFSAQGMGIIPPAFPCLDNYVTNTNSYYDNSINVFIVIISMSNKHLACFSITIFNKLFLNFKLLTYSYNLNEIKIYVLSL
jgi:hypothetical protein